MNCTVRVRVRDDGTDVWCRSQVVGRAQKVAVEAIHLLLEKVRIYNQLLGGRLLGAVSKLTTWRRRGASRALYMGQRS